MKDSLADALLGRVMGWDEIEPGTVETLRHLQVLVLFPDGLVDTGKSPSTPDSRLLGNDGQVKRVSGIRHIQVETVLARHKYDQYERFGAGRKFIESLADWLRQFEPGQERNIALDFVKRRLIFVSNSEMEQLVGILYQKLIRPIIRQHVSNKHGLPNYAVSQIESMPEFSRARRRSLFLGLSDGARMDEFRRNNRELSNEQVYATYEVAEPRLSEMRRQLLKDQLQASSEPIQFELVFLLDDFAGSGKSVLREEDGKFVGRLQRFSDLLYQDTNSQVSVFSGPDTEIHICLYVATQQAVEQLTESINAYATSAWNRSPTVHAVQILDPDQRIEPSKEPAFCQLIDKYYDTEIEDSAKRVGGTSSKYGFAEGALPLVLSHNSPNNSISLLWAPPPMKALFPRFQRHTDTGG